MILLESAKPADDSASNRLPELAQLGKPRKPSATISEPEVQALARANHCLAPKPEASA